MKLGYLPDPPDTRDYQFNTIASGLVKLANTTSNEYIIPDYTPISDQYALSSCVANATCDALEVLMGHQGKVEQLSRLFVYWNSRMYHKATDQDSGTYIRCAFDSLSTLGVCSENLWKYDVTKVFAQPPITAYKSANDNTINAYYRIASYGEERLTDIEKAIRANHPVVFGTAISQEFAEYFNKPVKVWSPPNSSIGNHAMIIMGFRNVLGRKEYYIRNSWSLGWGENGYTWMSADYLTWSRTQDLWVPTYLANLI